jgi:tungstate transport system ATP-binding protein
VKVTNSEPIIETTDLGQRLNGQDVLRNINLRIDRGEVIALIGPIGSGKTTLLRLLDLIDTPSQGKVYFNGTDVTESTGQRLEARRHMAFVLQKPVVFNTSVYDNIAYGLKWRGISGDSIRKRVDDVLEMIDMVDFRRKNARTLSGGEMQKVAIARAIATEPEVLLLDEPTANLDPVSLTKTEELITDIIQRYQTTIVMATHDMSQGQRLAERVGILLGGEMLQTGAWQEAFNTPRNREMANFVGVENIIDGVVLTNDDNVVTISTDDGPIEAVSDCIVGDKVHACIRSEEVTLALSRLSSSARNTFTGEIRRLTITGPVARVEIDCGFRLISLITRRSAEEMSLEKGAQVHASFKATAVHVIKQD